ncbi:MAG: GNAT family N-acetyltransferase [Desulfobacteraceae bacterium]|nr:GNAT family N-acetyltransferase [Desulfobacteraceae bacterium]
MIREINKTDFKNLAALSIQVWLHTYATDGIRTRISDYVLDRFTPDYFKKIYHSKNQKLIVYEKDNHLLGFITIDLTPQCPADACSGYEIVTFYVQEHFQGKGIGSKLLKSAMEKYGARLWLTTWIHNTPAIKFYEKAGFQNIGTTYFDLEGEKHKNVILQH